MPKKKGKKKSKKASKKSNDVEDLNIEGDGAQLGIGKKKKKKVKLTKEEKAAAKLAKKLNTFITNEELYGKFLHKIDAWMKFNQVRAEELFKKFDPEDDGVVSFEVFRSGLNDLLCPVTSLELRALTKMLDPEDSGMIEYCGFERGIHNRTLPGDEVDDSEDEKLVPDDYVPDIVTTPRGTKALPDPLHASAPRFIDLKLRLAVFDHVPKHPAHFQVTVRSTMAIATLHKLIVEVGHVTTGQLSVYADENCEDESRLPIDRTLLECGFVGGPEYDPPPVTFYYNYPIEFSDCPLLNCDHYFGHEKRPLNPVLTAYPKRQKGIKSSELNYLSKMITKL